MKAIQSFAMYKCQFCARLFPSQEQVQLHIDEELLARYKSRLKMRSFAQSQQRKHLNQILPQLRLLRWALRKAISKESFNLLISRAPSDLRESKILLESSEQEVAYDDYMFKYYINHNEAIVWPSKRPLGWRALMDPYSNDRPRGMSASVSNSFTPKSLEDVQNLDKTMTITLPDLAGMSDQGMVLFKTLLKRFKLDFFELKLAAYGKLTLVTTFTSIFKEFEIRGETEFSRPLVQQLASELAMLKKMSISTALKDEVDARTDIRIAAITQHLQEQDRKVKMRKRYYQQQADIIKQQKAQHEALTRYRNNMIECYAARHQEQATQLVIELINQQLTSVRNVFDQHASLSELLANLPQHSAHLTPAVADGGSGTSKLEALVIRYQQNPIAVREEATKKLTQHIQREVLKPDTLKPESRSEQRAAQEVVQWLIDQRLNRFECVMGDSVETFKANFFTHHEQKTLARSELSRANMDTLHNLLLRWLEMCELVFVLDSAEV